MKTSLCTLAAFVALTAVAPAQSPAPVYESFKLRYTNKATDAPTGIVLAVRQRDTPAGQQPPTVRKSVFRLTRGTSFDTDAIRRCGASDAEIEAGGAGACPPASRLGRGEADVFLGAGGELTLDVTAFNARRELVVVLATPSTGAVIRVIRARIRRSTVTAVFPKVPLAGGFEAALTRFELRLRAKGSLRRPWAATPAVCPRSGRWRVSYTATYDEPVGPETVRDASRCRSN
jgi:hypothetical protein